MRRNVGRLVARCGLVVGGVRRRSARWSRTTPASGSRRSRCARRRARTASRSCTARCRGRCGTRSGRTGRSTRCRSPRSRTACTAARGSPTSSRSCSATPAGLRRARTSSPDEVLWSAHRAAKERMLGFIARTRGADAPRSGRAHDRLRAPLRDVQARRPALQPSRSGCCACSAIRSGRCRSSSPARRTRRRGRQGRDPARRRVRPRPRGRRPRRLPRGLRDDARPPARPGRRRLAEHAAAADGGVGHLRDEGGAQRRAELLDPRRLVGGGVLADARVRDRQRRRRPSGLGAGRGRRGGALPRARGAGACRRTTSATRTVSRRGGSG